MKFRKHAATLGVALAALAVQATARDAAPVAAPQAAIPFINQRSSIRDWQADGREGLWVQDGRRQWYYAELTVPCIGLDLAIRVAFNTRGTTSFDKFGEILVPGYDRCPLKSFTKSAAPPGHETAVAVEDAEAAE